MNLLIPTPHELDQLDAGTLRAALRPMVPQPPEGTTSMRRTPLGGENRWRAYLADDEYGEVTSEKDFIAPFAPGDVIAWGEDWVRAPGCCLQPAATMPVELARHRHTVVERRPVKVSELPAEDIERLGFESLLVPGVASLQLLDGSDGAEIEHTVARRVLETDWQSNNPKHPFATSWAWWIGLKGT